MRWLRESSFRGKAVSHTEQCSGTAWEEPIPKCDVIGVGFQREEEGG